MNQDDKYYYADEPDSPGHTPVYVETETTPRRELDKRLDLKNHSPDGFSWGYRGSGPAQLSLAILADFYSDGYAVKAYRRFMKSFVAQYDEDAPFYVTADEIRFAVESGT